MWHQGWSSEPQRYWAGVTQGPQLLRHGQGRAALGKHCLLTSDRKEASSSEFESSACRVLLVSRGSLSAFPLSPLLLLLSLDTFLSGKEEVRGEVPGARRAPFDPLFLGFLALGFGESVAAGRLLEALGRVGGCGAPLGDRLSSLVSFRAILGSLKAALGAGAFSSLGSLRAASLALLGSRSGSLEQLLLSESLRGRSRCSLATLCGLDALPLSLLASCKAKGREGEEDVLAARWCRLALPPRPGQGLMCLFEMCRENPQSKRVQPTDTAELCPQTCRATSTCSYWHLSDLRLHLTGRCLPVSLRP